MLGGLTPLTISRSTDEVVHCLCRPEPFATQPDGRRYTTLLDMRIQRAQANTQYSSDFGGRKVSGSNGVACDGRHRSVAFHDLARHGAVDITYKTHGFRTRIFEATAYDVVMHAENGAGWNLVPFGPGYRT